MIARWTRQLIPTLRETPQEAEIPSHRWMLRAGLIRRLGGGLYTYLPLGLRTLRKVDQIVREEMDRAGALEVLMPALHPREIWEATGRWDIMQQVMFAMVDRQGRNLVLGPTHEEVVTGIAAGELSSYRDLPRNFYQIQTKFRDEIRPRFGLMRAKEFIMKDAYSFDADLAGVDRSYQAMYDAYTRIFHRCGLDTTVVEADSGAMGGSSSHEFMVVSEVGEDGIVVCSSCGYAANLERAESGVEEGGASPEPAPPMETVDTPDARTIEDVATFLGVPAASLAKTLIYTANGEPVAVMAPGDRDINEVKLGHVLDEAELALADDGLIEKVTGAPVGFAGPVGLTIPVIADRRLRGATVVTGANEKDKHCRHVDLERDAGEIRYADVTLAREGDACPRCGEPLVEKRGIEVGHVFKLGTKYSEALGATFLDADGELRPMIMGCYGIGVSRTLQSVIEQHYDKDGIQWPVSVAPYPVEVVILKVGHAQSVEVADALVAGLDARGIDVLVDDRAERPGVKFKDADLVGCPIRVAIGERSLGEGVVEIKLRAEDEVARVPIDEAAGVVAERLATLEEALA